MTEHEKSAYNLGRACRSLIELEYADLCFVLSEVQRLRHRKMTPATATKGQTQAMFRSWSEADCWRKEQEVASMCYYWKTVQRKGWYVVERMKK